MKVLHLAFILNALGVCYCFGTEFGTSLRIQDVSAPVVDEEYVISHELYLNADKIMITNFTILKRLPENTRWHITMWGSSMGQYVVPTALDIEMELCDVFQEPIIMPAILTELGFTIDDCPPSPGIYGTTGDYSLPTDKLPDQFPRDEYLLITELISSDHLLARAYFYFVVE